MTMIDPTARIEAGAVIGHNATIGAYCTIGPGVTIGDECRIGPHANISGRTAIGARTAVYPFASLGTEPQSVHYRGEPTSLVIGSDCVLREHVTVNTGTAGGRGVTTIGDHCMLMVGAHVGHDCVIGSHVTFANNATVAGLCEIGDYVFLGGLSAVHQFTRVGEQVMVGGLSGVADDVIPYAIVAEHWGKLAGLNRIGLKRRGLSAETIGNIYRGYRAIFFGPGSLTERVDRLAERSAGDLHVMRIIEFIRADKTRRLMLPRARGGGGD
ncbi:MAG: acyl-ACP--UDP-N-acetylglucosamine O-acyltransferase [Pseudolabrys sp.]